MTEAVKAVQQSPRKAETAAPPLVDQKTLQLVWASLKDRIYQRSFNLRKTYRELDAIGNGLIPISQFVEEMGRAYQLSALERQCLELLLIQSDFRHDGVIDFREFCEMLKLRDNDDNNATLNEKQRKRFAQRGLMDLKMQNAIVKSDRSIKVQGGMPTNELGQMCIECPYGVLGDSERMDAVIAAYLDVKYEKLHTVFEKHDANKDGCLTWIEFRACMKELDPYVFDDEIDTLLSVLDKKKKGLIPIQDFVNGLGQEYLKKKAHRSNAHANPFHWESPRGDKSPREQLVLFGGKGLHNSETSPDNAKNSRRQLKKAGSTRASDLRTVDARAKLTEMTRLEDDDFRHHRHAIPKPPPLPKAVEAGAAFDTNPRQGTEPPAAAASSQKTPRLPAIGKVAEQQK